MHIYPILDHSGVSLTENSIIVKGTLLCKLSSEFLLVINRSFQQQVIGASVLIVAQIYLLICPSACLKCVYLLVLFGTINLFIWYYPSIHLVLPVCLAQTICTSDTICIDLSIHLSIHPQIYPILSIWYYSSSYHLSIVYYPCIHPSITHFILFTNIMLSIF